MSLSIDPNTLYTRAELRKRLGAGTFDQAQAAGLYAIGDRYLGAKVLEYLAAAHEHIRTRRVAKKGDDANHETPQMEEDPQDDPKHPLSGRRGAADVLRAMAPARHGTRC